MTDAAPPPDDEIVSAVLDGEATAAERALVADDPAARARADHFDEIRQRVSEPVTVPGAAREQAVAAALAEFDRATGSGSVVAGVPDIDRSPTATTPDPAPPDDLTARRAHRARRGRTGPILAAAAAVVLVLIGVGAVARTISRSTTEVTASGSLAERALPSTTVTRDAGSGSGAPDNESNAATDAGPAVTTTMPTTLATPTTPPAPNVDAGIDPQAGQFTEVPPVAVGRVTTPAQLRAAMVGIIDQRGSTVPTTSDPGSQNGEAGAVLSCGTQLLATDPELGALLATATATYQGRAAVVYVFSIDQARFPAANGDHRLYAVDAVDCSTLSVQTF